MHKKTIIPAIIGSLVSVVSVQSTPTRGLSIAKDLHSKQKHRYSFLCQINFAQSRLSISRSLLTLCMYVQTTFASCHQIALSVGILGGEKPWPIEFVFIQLTMVNHQSPRHPDDAQRLPPDTVTFDTAPRLGRSRGRPGQSSGSRTQSSAEVSLASTSTRSSPPETVTFDTAPRLGRLRGRPGRSSGSRTRSFAEASLVSTSTQSSTRVRWREATNGSGKSTGNNSIQNSARDGPRGRGSQSDASSQSSCYHLNNLVRNINNFGRQGETDDGNNQDSAENDRQVRQRTSDDGVAQVERLALHAMTRVTNTPARVHRAAHHARGLMGRGAAT